MRTHGGGRIPIQLPPCFLLLAEKHFAEVTVQLSATGGRESQRRHLSFPIRHFPWIAAHADWP
jgi:hypothetical protein